MSVLSLPSSAGIARMRWELQRNDVMDGLQALRASDPLWRVSLEMSPDLEANSGYLKALLMRLRGGVNQLELHDWARPAPVGTYRGTLTLASSVAAGATSMSIVAANNNLILSPENMNGTGTGGWGKTGAGTGSAPTVVLDDAVAPDGTLSADRVTFALNGGTTINDGSALTPTVTTIVGQPTVGAVYLKTADGSTKQIRIDYNGQPAINNALATVTVTPTWQRFLPGALSSVGDNVRRMAIRLRGTQNTSDSAVLHIWGAQQYNNVTTLPDYGHGKTLKKGDLLGIGSGTTQQVVMVTEDATSTSQGNMTVQFQPPLRNAFAGGQSVVWDEPKALFRRVSNELGWDYRGKNVITSGIGIDLIEDTRP